MFRMLTFMSILRVRTVYLARHKNVSATVDFTDVLNPQSVHGERRETTSGAESDSKEKDI